MNRGTVILFLSCVFLGAIAVHAQINVTSGIPNIKPSPSGGGLTWYDQNVVDTDGIQQNADADSHEAFAEHSGNRGGKPITASNGGGGKSHVAATSISMAYPSFSPSSTTITVGYDYSRGRIMIIPFITPQQRLTAQWNSGDVAPGGTYSHTFNTVGTVQYQCNYHAAMGDAEPWIVSSFAVQAAIDTTCYNVPYQLSPDITGGVAPLTYQWSPATGLSSSTVAQPVATISTTTTYTLTVTDANSNQVSANIMLVVLPKPSVTAGAGITLCQGTTGTITGVATGGIPPLTYTWYPLTGVVSTTNNSATVQPNVTTTYWLVATGANGCSDSDSVVVKVPIPPSLNVGNPTLCAGDTAQIGADASGGTPPYTYNWSPPDGLSATNVAQPSAHPAKTTTYTVSVTDSNGCQTSGQVSIFVVPSPRPSIVTPSQTICNGDTAYLDSPDTNYAAYLWSTGETTEGIQVWKTGKYSVTVTGQNGCAATVSIRLPCCPHRPCLLLRQTVRFRFAKGGVCNFPRRRDYLPICVSDGEKFQEITVTQSGIYSVTTTGQNGCSSSSAPVAVSVYPASALIGATEECANAQATYAVNDSASYKNTWTVTNGTIQSGQGTNSIVVQWGATGIGMVADIETTPLGCIDTATMHVVVGSSLKPVVGITGDTVFKERRQRHIGCGRGIRDVSLEHRRDIGEDHGFDPRGVLRFGQR